MSLVDIAHGRTRHVPYRDSKLTFLLRVGTQSTFFNIYFSELIKLLYSHLFMIWVASAHNNDYNKTVLRLYIGVSFVNSVINLLDIFYKAKE